MKNNKAPQITVPVVLIKKIVRSYYDQTTKSWDEDYFAKFEFDSGDQREFQISHSAYRHMNEGDYGMLTFKGTRYLAFSLISKDQGFSEQENFKHGYEERGYTEQDKSNQKQKKGIKMF